MSNPKGKQKKGTKAPIVLDDLLPMQDVKGGATASVVFGVLSNDKPTGTLRGKKTKKNR